MPTVEEVRVILERTFGMPVAESDAQIVLDRLNGIARQEAAQHGVHPTPPSACPACGTLIEEAEHDPTCPLASAGG